MIRTSSHKAGLAWFAAIGSLWVFVLVALGAFTTSIGAGMVFRDWPLSNGSLNPHGWLTQINEFAEHSHRLSGTVMGLITIVLAIWVHRAEARAWLRKLGWWALALVVVQGLLGGTRVMFDRIHVPGFEMSLGQMLRIPHGVVAQVFVCMLFAISAGLSRAWIENTLGTAGERVRRLGRWCVALLLLQLALAATMRHNYAGMSIPTFPYSTADGALLPATWDYRIALQFAHRVMAVAIGIAVLVYSHFLWRDAGLRPLLRSASILPVGLVALQIYLGAQIIWTGRSAYMTTAHVLSGALTLATIFVMVFFTHRESIEKSRS